MHKDGLYGRRSEFGREPDERNVRLKTTVCRTKYSSYARISFGAVQLGQCQNAGHGQTKCKRPDSIPQAVA